MSQCEDAPTPTRTISPRETWTTQPSLWTLQIAHHPDPRFVGRKMRLAVGVEATLGRAARHLTNADEPGVLQHDDISRDHLFLRALPEHLQVRINGKNGAKVGLESLPRGTTVNLSDQAVLSLSMKVEGVIFVVRRTFDVVREPIHPEIVGTSAEIAEVIRKVGRYGPTHDVVMLRGETGTGKELLARALHDASNRPGSFEVLNAALLRKDLVASELFGHIKGAFTHALANRKGLAELACNGTLFFDEIADIDNSLQAMMLRFFAEKEGRRVGSDALRTYDTRIICAANADLAELVRQGRFRSDLYHRLMGMVIDVPALRHRLDDLPALAQHFAKECANHAHRRFDVRMMRRMLCHSWPGNIRELRNFVHAAIAESEGLPSITMSEDLEKRLRESLEMHGVPSVGKPHTSLSTTTAEPGRENASVLPDVRKKRLPSIERVVEALTKHHGNVDVAATELGIHRPRVYDILGKHGMKPADFRKVDGEFERPMGKRCK